MYTWEKEFLGKGERKRRQVGGSGSLDGHQGTDTKCWRSTISAVLIERFGSFSNVSLPCLGEGIQTFCGRNTPNFVYNISLFCCIYLEWKESQGVFPALNSPAGIGAYMCK